MILIGASKGYSLPSKIVKFWQGGYPFTHIFYVIDCSVKENPFIIEASHAKRKVVKGNFFDFHSSNTDFAVFKLEATDEQKSTVESFLESQIGKPYDMIGLLAFPLRRWKIAKNDKWFCSELIFEALLAAGIKILRDTISQEVSPRLFLKSPLLQEYYEFDSSKSKLKIFK